MREVFEVVLNLLKESQRKSGSFEQKETRSLRVLGGDGKDEEERG